MDYTIRRALLSVSDKTGLIPLARFLHERGVDLLSTGGTARALREEGLPVRDVSDVTGFPEMMDGRVKTLHPAIHGGILGRDENDGDQESMRRAGIDPIDLIVVNLYPFRAFMDGRTLNADLSVSGSSPDSHGQSSGASEGSDAAQAEPGASRKVPLGEAVEFIDIGGPTLIRAAAKNVRYRAVLVDPAQYEGFMQEYAQDGTVSSASRIRLAQQAFQHTAAYDAAISASLTDLTDPDGRHLPDAFTAQGEPLGRVLRYGENPHQAAGVYGQSERYVRWMHGKEPSYNNFLDLDAAIGLIAEFRDREPTCAILKHTVPCGVGTGSTAAESYRKAFETDRTSPFGGVIAFNTQVDEAAAELLDEIFSEIIAAPSFTPDAERRLREKKNRRLVHIHTWPESRWQWRSIFCGTLLQQADSRTPAGFGPGEQLRVVTRRQPTQEEAEAMAFAWRVVRHVKSNAIVLARADRTLGVGTGQTSRVLSTRIAIANAAGEGLELAGSTLASDAFFPFADGVRSAAEAGVSAIIQPGGSVRDQEVIDEADRQGIAMVFTGERHFRH